MGGGGGPEFCCKCEGRLSLTTVFVIFRSAFDCTQLFSCYSFSFFLSFEKGRMPLGKCNILTLLRSRIRPQRAGTPLYIVRNIIHWIEIVNWLIIQAVQLNYRTQTRGESNVHVFPHVILISRGMGCARHVARMEEGRGVSRILVGKPWMKEPLGRSRRRWGAWTRLIWFRIETGGGHM